MADNSEIIGGVGVTVSGDFSDLAQDFEAAVALAVSQGATLAEAIQSAMVTPDVTPVTDALESIAPAAQSAAEQLSLFGAAADNIPFADAAGQLNLFTTEIEPFVAGVQAAGEAATAAGPPIHDLGEHAKEAHGGVHSLLEAMLEFTGIEIGIHALKEFATECVEVYANLQQVVRGLTALDGSAEEAEKTIERLKSMATADALSFPQLQTAQVRMQAAGIELDRIPALLEAAAGPAKAMGADFETVAFKLTTMATNGNVAARSLNAIGLSTEELGKVMGVAASEVSAQFKAMDPSSRIEVIEEAMHKFAGVVAADSGNIKDQWQLLKNQADFLFEAIGKDILPAALAFVGFMRDATANAEMLVGALKAVIPSMDGLQASLVIVDVAATALNMHLGVLLATVEFLNATLSYFNALKGIKTQTEESDAALTRLVKTINETIPATGAFRDQLNVLGGAFRLSGDIATYERGLTSLMNAFHASTGFVAAASTGVHTFTLGLQAATEAADKYKAPKFGDLSGGATDAQITSAIILQTFKDQESAIQKTIGELAKYHEALAANADAFKMDTALPQLTAIQLGLGNVSKELNASGQTAKEWSASLTAGAQGALGPFAALDRVMKSLGQRDELSALQQYAKNVADIKTALDGTAISAARAGEMMKEAWLKAHPDITKADDSIQRITQHMEDLRTAAQMGIISFAQMSQDIQKDMEKLHPVIKQIHQEMTQMFNSLNSELASDIVHWKGWRASITSIGQTLAQDIIRMMITALFGPIEARIATMVTQWITGSAAQATASTTAATEAAVAAKVSAIAQVQAYAGVAFAAAFAAEAAIPIIGPALAPAAGAAAYAEVMAGGMASLDKGGPIDKDMVAQLHKGEFVLTADQMGGRVALPAIGGTSSSFSSSNSTNMSTVNNSGGDVHFHGNFSGVTKDAVQQVMNHAVKMARRVNAKW